MKVGDLVVVGMTGDAKPVVGIITEICLPEEHRNAFDSSFERQWSAMGPGWLC
jgi:hypothetical protein